MILFFRVFYIGYDYECLIFYCDRPWHYRRSMKLHLEGPMGDKLKWIGLGLIASTPPRLRIQSNEFQALSELRQASSHKASHTRAAVL